MNYRHPTAEDGAEIWRIVRDSGVLDLNSSYCYLMMGQYFSDSCIVAEDEDSSRLAGFIIGFRPPKDQEALFVWQVAVDSDYRGQGIAGTMLTELLRLQPPGEVRYIEATISPSNAASQALFSSIAKKLNTDINSEKLFPADWFPGSAAEHEAEDRYRVGPIK